MLALGGQLSNLPAELVKSAPADEECLTSESNGDEANLGGKHAALLSTAIEKLGYVMMFE